MNYPLATLGPQVTEQGITAPSYADILASLQATFQAIYGSDVYIAPDSQDGQLLAAFAAAINDNNQAAIAVYNSFSPTFAQGAALSAYVKINGIARQPSSHSTATVTVAGTSGTQIVRGSVKDAAGNIWDLPELVVIPVAGTIDVTATARDAGAIIALAHDIDIIYTPTVGWQSVDNAADATTGVDIETDAALRRRQSVSTSLPAVSPLQAVLASVAQVAGVSRYAIYENDTGSTDTNGLPAHSIAVVVDGGGSAEIASVIQRKKAPGVATHGATSVVTEDPSGVLATISFDYVQNKPVYVALTIKALSGYVTSTGDIIKQAIVDFLNSLSIGEDVYYAWLYKPAGLAGNSLGDTFKVTDLKIDFTATPTGVADLTIAYNEAAQGVLADITLTVT